MWPVSKRVGAFLTKITTQWEPPAPENITQGDWEKIYWPGKGISDPGARWVGILESFLFLAALWLVQPIIIGGWLAFKVATKWEVWRNVVRVPENLGVNNEISYFQARSAWGTWLFNRFLVGTLMNLMIAVAAYSLVLCVFWLWQHSDRIMKIL